MALAHAAGRNRSEGVCRICGQRRRRSELVPAGTLRPSLLEHIRRQVPELGQQDLVCTTDLDRFRGLYVEQMLQSELGEISSLERSVVDRIARHETLSIDTESELQGNIGLGGRLADRVASFGGSWWFIMLFGAVMASWMALNSLLLAGKAFDPYPYILLNLVLSCLAAIQAPVIMMSQNRQEARDRGRARNDYLVNLKAELEIRLLHEKLDHLVQHQFERLIEIQQIQIELMAELRSRHPR